MDVLCAVLYANLFRVFSPKGAFTMKGWLVIGACVLGIAVFVGILYAIAAL